MSPPNSPNWLSCNCDPYGIPKFPVALQDACVIVEPLEESRTMNLGLGRKAFMMNPRYRVHLRLDNDALVRQWKDFHENTIHDGGGMFFMKLNRFGVVQYVLVRLTKFSPDFTKKDGVWSTILDLEETFPPHDQRYHPNGEWAWDTSGVGGGGDPEPIYMPNCTYFIFSTDDDPSVAGNQDMNTCLGPIPRGPDFFRDGHEIAFYKFDGDNNDSGPNNHQPGNADNTWIEGYIGQAARFDPDGGVGITYPNFPLDYNNFTLSFWIAPDGTDNATIFKSGDGADTFVEIRYYASNQSLEVGGSAFIDPNTGIELPAKSGAGEINDPVNKHQYVVVSDWHMWTHIAIIFQPNHDVYIFSGGQRLYPYDPDAAIGHIYNHYTDSTQFTLGESPYGGRLEHMRLYDRVLTDAEIKQLAEEVA